MWPIILALVLQTGDAAITCNMLYSGLYREVNPVLGNTCKDVVLRKSLIIGGSYLAFKNHSKWVSIGLISSGAVGITVNLYNVKRNKR